MPGSVDRTIHLIIDAYNDQEMDKAKREQNPDECHGQKERGCEAWGDKFHFSQPL